MPQHPNNKGAALIISFFVLTFLVIISAGVALSLFSELAQAQNYQKSVTAFWLAESGLSLFKKNPTMLDEKGSQVLSYGAGKIDLRKDESDPAMRVVTSTGTVLGVRRSLEIVYPAKAPEAFNTSMATGGNLTIASGKASVVFLGKLRLNGKVVNNARHANVIFEDKKESVESSLVTLKYPDINQNGMDDEFSDFVKANQQIISKYPKSEVLYVQGNDNYTIIPGKGFIGKKIIYVEGEQSKGRVNIQFNGSMPDDQNLTIISTGNVTLSHGNETGNSQLNVIAWGDYSESAILPGVHNGMIFTHGMARFDDIYDTAVTNGCIVASEGIAIGDIWSTKVFNYADPRKDGAVPPGFELLIGKRASGYVSTPGSWREN